MNFSTIVDGDVLDMEFSPSMNNVNIIQKKNKQKIDCVRLGAHSFSLILNGQTYHLTITPDLEGYNVIVDHCNIFVQVKDRLELLLEKLGIEPNQSDHTNEIHAPIPGLVNHIFVKSGDTVQTGDKLCILEAMKMENEIATPKNGTVTQLHIKSGTNVEKGDLLMEITD